MDGETLISKFPETYESFETLIAISPMFEKLIETQEEASDNN